MPLNLHHPRLLLNIISHQFNITECTFYNSQTSQFEDFERIVGTNDFISESIDGQRTHYESGGISNSDEIDNCIVDIDILISDLYRAKGFLNIKRRVLSQECKHIYSDGRSAFTEGFLLNACLICGTIQFKDAELNTRLSHLEN